MTTKARLFTKSL